MVTERRIDLPLGLPQDTSEDFAPASVHYHQKNGNILQGIAFAFADSGIVENV